MVKRSVSPARLVICQTCGAVIRARVGSGEVVLTYDLRTLQSSCRRSDDDMCPLLMAQIAKLLLGTQDQAAEERCGIRRLN